ncbi:hypothetical protein UM48_004722 [Salmonella enterica subsp. enterica]|nr:hypothetical protein [Salmonella enterica subsp. enterica]
MNFESKLLFDRLTDANKFEALTHLIDRLTDRVEALEGLAAEYESERQQDLYESIQEQNAIFAEKPKSAPEVKEQMQSERATVSTLASVAGTIAGLQWAVISAEQKAKDAALSAERWETVKRLHSEGDHVGAHSFIDAVINGEIA